MNTNETSTAIGRTFIEKFNDIQLNGIEYKGEPCVLAFQQADAMGADRDEFGRHIRRQIDSGEMSEGRHAHRIMDPALVRLLSDAMGGPDNLPGPLHASSTRVILLTRHGAIRAAMTSRAPKAKEFRDWAEDVLFNVLTTGKHDEAPARLLANLREVRLYAAAMHRAGRSKEENAAFMRASETRVGVTFTVTPAALPTESRLTSPWEARLPEWLSQQSKGARLTTVEVLAALGASHPTSTDKRRVNAALRANNWRRSSARQFGRVVDVWRPA